MIGNESSLFVSKFTKLFRKSFYNLSKKCENVCGASVLKKAYLRRLSKIYPV